MPNEQKALLPGGFSGRLARRFAWADADSRDPEIRARLGPLQGFVCTAISIVLSLILNQVCLAAASVHLSAPPQGHYTGRDGDLELSVTLREDNCYRVEWLQPTEQGVKGVSRGRWKVEGDRVRLEVFEHGGGSGLAQFAHMNSLKEFRLVAGEHHFMLVPEWGYAQLAQVGVSPAIACYWVTNAPAPFLVPIAELPVMSVREVIARKRELRGRRVCVVGEYSSGFEWSVLRDDRNPDVRDRAQLWIGQGPVEWANETNVQWIKRGRVEVVGAVTYIEDSPGGEGRYGHLGMCPAGLVDIEYFKETEAGSTNPDSRRAAASATRMSDLAALLRRAEADYSDNVKRDASGRVISLALRRIEATDDNLRLVRELRSLQSLTIQGRGSLTNHWSAEGVSVLSALTNLHTLSVACIPMLSNGNFAAICKLTRLQSVTLYGADAPQEEYGAITNLQNLAKLSITYSMNFGDPQLWSLTNLLHLRSLELSSDAITEEAAQRALAVMNGPTNLLLRSRSFGPVHRP